MLKVLSTAPGFEESGADIIREVADLDLTWNRTQRLFSEDELAEMVPNYDGVIVWIDPMKGKALLAAKSRVKIIGVPRAGFDNVDANEAANLGIPVVYAPGANASAVADFVLGLIIGLSRRIPQFTEQLKRGTLKDRWAMSLGRGLDGKTLGIIGLGNIGSRVAIRARAFGMEIISYDPYVTGVSTTSLGLYPQELGVRLVPLETLLKESDYVTIHMPITKETYHMIGPMELNQMKKGAYMINTSRGGIINERALYKALRKGHLSGAALDVFEKEPLDTDNPLCQLGNVILTPHVAWCTHEAMSRCNLLVATEIVKALTGKPINPRFLANPEVVRSSPSVCT